MDLSKTALTASLYMFNKGFNAFSLAESNSVEPYSNRNCVGMKKYVSCMQI